MPLDRSEGVGTGRAEDHLGFGNGALNAREVLVRTSAGEFDFALYSFGEHIDSRTGDAERHARALGQDSVVAPPDRTFALGRIKEAEAVTLGYEKVRHPIIVAAGAAQAGGVPGVLDFKGRRGREHDLPSRRTRRVTDLLAVFVDYATGRNDVGVGDAGAKHPLARDAIAPIDFFRATSRPDPSGGGEVETLIELAPGVIVEEARVDAGVAADHHAPTDRGVGPGKLLDNLDLLDGAEFRPAPYFGH